MISWLMMNSKKWWTHNDDDQWNKWNFWTSEKQWKDTEALSPVSQICATYSRLYSCREPFRCKVTHVMHSCYVDNFYDHWTCQYGKALRFTLQQFMRFAGQIKAFFLTANDHTVKYSTHQWTGVWSELSIEQTLIRYCKSLVVLVEEG